ncbi:hypothetical protein [Rhizobium leguminosarum]|uniref:hypothetical protein n=1 Tax=Rhizobium leguminosarum TaxID=384 RepID=UPI00161D11B3|nr:hypothetical protein [Rhizobium leguminosarum]MBB4342101.1 hypothetical protein [Rhizobium leguminosarum]MBB6294725.1 hypothetical protein [Rhizobium leguminosarum]
MRKHTPGPWAVEDPMGAEIGLSIVQDGLKTYEWEFIAMVCQSTAGDERMGRQRFISPKEQEANARLIAAAPDLLEALKNLAAAAAGGWPISEELIAAGYAIAKAEGRS